MDRIAPRMNVLWAASQTLSRSAEDLSALARKNQGLSSLPVAQIASDLAAISEDINVVTLFFSVRTLLRPDAEREFRQRFLVNLLSEKKGSVEKHLQKILDFYDELGDPQALAIARSSETAIRRSLFEMTECLRELAKKPATGAAAGNGQKANP
ncbi:MAG: hypothetical protein AB1921_09685 [Thermodesulfobacteriota bacterium]